MEELKKLEQLQGMITIMESRGVIEPPSNHDNSNELDSHRFLSKFALFLMEPCGELSLHDKSRLISNHLPKISATFVDAELKLPCGRNGYDMNSFLLADQVDRKNDCFPSPSESEGMCFIGLDAMQRANSTLEDFCRSYFMFHGMDPNSAKAIFRYLPVLSFTESYIYQEDVLENNFNVLRMFVHLYGTSNASTMLAKYIDEVEEKYDHLLKALDPQLSQNYQRRCEEATSEGGSMSGHPLGSWTIPPLIANEELYRSSYGHQATSCDHLPQY